MPQLDFRMNLQSKLFPLLAQLQGQTVIIPERDQTYVPNVNPQDDQNAVDRGIPGILYAHNVMPSSYGWQSVGYLPRVTGTLGGAAELLTHVPRTVNGYSTYVVVNSTANTLMILNQAGQWIPATIANPIPSGTQLSVATLNGISYVCVRGIGTYRIVMDTHPYFEHVPLVGLEDSKVLGILSSNGYMIAWSASGVAWSSPSDPTEFRPLVDDDGNTVPEDDPSGIGIETGAGSGEIQDAAGDIIWCQDTSYGMIIYTRGNAVQATWSGNTAHPWNFRGIPSSGGIDSPRAVSKEANGQHWVYTSKGLQQIYHTGAKTVLPFITDFLSGKEMDDWVPGAPWYVVNRTNRALKKALAFVGDRYLVLSYALHTSPVFTHALVFDTVQQRIGKLRFPHVQVFEINSSGADDIEAARDSIGLLSVNGQIHSVDFRLSADTHDGVILLGKFQVARGYMSQLVKVGMENVNEGSGIPTYKVLNYPSLDGKNPIVPQEGYDNSPGNPDYREWLFNTWGKNHSIYLRGSFNLVSVELTLNAESGR